MVGGERRPTDVRLLVVALLGCAVLGACRSADAVPAERPPTPRISDSGGPDPLVEVAAPLPARSPAAPVSRPAAESGASGLAAPGRDRGDGVLYRIGGRSVTDGDLGDFLLRYFPDRARDALGQLVDRELVRAEAEREGVSVDDDVVRSRADAYVDERRRQVRLQYGPDAVLEELLEDGFGRSFAEFEEDARRLARIALLRDRLVRLDQVRLDRAEVRALVFSNAAGAEAAAQRLRDGADMTLLARTLGLRDPASPPPLARDEISPPERADEVFSASAGDVLAPRAFADPDGREWYEVVKVVAVTAGSSEPWTTLRAGIDASMAASPVAVAEYLAWRRRALRRAGVEVRRGVRGMLPWISEDGQ